MAGNIHIGGVMRCCIATFDDTPKEELAAIPRGSILWCQYCKGGLRRRDDDDWEWAQEERETRTPWRRRMTTKNSSRQNKPPTS